MNDDLTKNLQDAIIQNVNKAILASVAKKPASPLLNLEDATIEAIEQFLSSKHSSTWSTFSISSPDSLEKAATWFQRELNQFHTFLYRIDEYKKAVN